MLDVVINNFSPANMLALAFLKLYYRENISILENNQENFNNDEIFKIGVGGEYNPSRKRFDYHQESFNERYVDYFSSNTDFKILENDIKLGPVGLILFTYGKESIKNVIDTYDFIDKILFNLEQKIEIDFDNKNINSDTDKTISFYKVLSHISMYENQAISFISNIEIIIYFLKSYIKELYNKFKEENESRKKIGTSK